MSIPDPSSLTTQQLLREIGLLREIIETRLDGNDKAISLLQTYTDKIPYQITSQIDTSVAQLQNLHEEKFLSIANQFNLRDVAVAAALKAAQEAVFAQQVANDRANTKMETSFEKRIEAVADLLAQVRDGLTDKIEDSKSRMTAIEAAKAGSDQTKTGIGSSFGYIITAIGVATTIMVAVVAWNHTTPPIAPVTPQTIMVQPAK